MLRNAEHALTDRRAGSTEVDARIVRPVADGGQPSDRTGRGAHQIEDEGPRVGDAEGAATCSASRKGAPRSRTRRANSTRRAAGSSTNQRVNDLDRQLIVQVKEARISGGHVNDLEGRLATQGKLLAKRQFENSQLKQANEAADRAARVRIEIAALSSGGNSPAIEKLRTEKAAVEVDSASHATNAPNCSATSTRSSSEPSSWATEQMENALLRERINDIAAEVADSRCSSRPEFGDRWPRNRGAQDPACVERHGASRRPQAAGTPPERIRTHSRMPPAPASRGPDSLPVFLF